MKALKLMLLPLLSLTMMVPAQATLFVKCFAYGNDKENYFLAINPQTQTIVYNLQVKDPAGLNGLGEGVRYQNVMQESKGPIHISFDPHQLNGSIQVTQAGAHPLTIDLNYQMGTAGRALGVYFFELHSISGGQWVPAPISQNYCVVKGLEDL